MAPISKRLVLVAALLVASIATWALCSEVPTLERFLEEDLAGNGYPAAFVTSCLKEPLQATLAVFPATGEGMLVELNGLAIVNIATFHFANGSPGADLETNGGEASRDRVVTLVEYLDEKRFILLRRTRALDLLRVQAVDTCP